MKDILLTSSVLILALLLLRQLFRHTISRWVQYALWALVLVRLLVPVSLPAADLSVLTAADALEQATLQRSAQISTLPQEAAASVPEQPGSSRTDGGSQDPTVPPMDTAAASDGPASTAARSVRLPPLSSFLYPLWYGGMIVMAVWLLTANLRFWRRLRKARIPYSIEGCRYPTYLISAGLPSPCLFGLFRPAIYLTPAAVQTSERLRHVLAHESAHARHLDHVWALLRGVCLTVYWFDPLVWAAAAASRTDGELACDEAALRRLGDGERAAYGKTLLSLIPVRKAPVAPLLSATTMTAGKRQLKDRVARIAGRTQTRAIALFAVLVLAAGVCAMTFTGPSTPPGPDSDLFRMETAISLLDVPPWEPEAAPTTDLPSTDIAWTLGQEELPDGTVVGWGYLADRTAVYWYADSPEAQTLHCFLTGRASAYSYDYGAERFEGILGREGFRVSYEAGEDLEPYRGEGNLYPAWRYYFFQDGNLYLLASAPGTVIVSPWPDALLSITSGHVGALLYFLRDGELYRAELASLLVAAYPDQDTVSIGWDSDTGMLRIDALLRDSQALRKRYGAFDGETLSVYTDARTLSDHVLGTPDVPDDVLAAAKNAVASWYQEVASSQNAAGRYDDWRIEHLEHVYTYSPDDGTAFYDREIQVYQLNHEFHTTTPLSEVILAGGMYVTEDGWVMPSYPDCTYLLFQMADGQRDFLYSTMENDCAPGDRMFTQDMEQTFLARGELTIAGMTQQELWQMFREHPVSAVVEIAACSDTEQDLGCRALAWSLGQDPPADVFRQLSQAGFTGREAQTLDLLRYYAGDLSYDTLPSEILELYKQVRDAWQQGRRSQIGACLYFPDAVRRQSFLDSQAGTPIYLQIEYGRWLNPELYAVVCYADGLDGRPLDPPHRYYFAGLIDGTWKWILHVDDIPAHLREGLDIGRYHAPSSDPTAAGQLEPVTMAEDGAEGSPFPESVLSAARQTAQADFTAFRVQDGVKAAQYDGWRLCYLAPVTGYAPFEGVPLEIYRVGWEAHAAVPEAVALAGSMEMDADGWVRGLSCASSYLIFLNEDGQYTQLQGDIAFDTAPDAPAFRAELAASLLRQGLVTPEQIGGDTFLTMFSLGTVGLLNTVGTLPQDQQAEAVELLASYHGQGQLDEEGTLRDAIQTTVWGQRDLTDAGGAVFRALLERTGIQAYGIGASHDSLEDAIYWSILDHHRDASGHGDDLYAASYEILYTQLTGCTCTVYLLTCFGSYDRTAAGSCVLQTGGAEPAALSFATVNGRYQLTEYWSPRGGADYAPDIRSRFPAEAAEAAIDPSPALLSSLEGERDTDAAERAALAEGASPLPAR